MINSVVQLLLFAVGPASVQYEQFGLENECLQDSETAWCATSTYCGPCNGWYCFPANELLANLIVTYGEECSQTPCIEYSYVYVKCWSSRPCKLFKPTVPCSPINQCVPDHLATISYSDDYVYAATPLGPCSPP